MSPDTNVKSLKGVGDKKVKLLKKLGIKTVSDLLYHMPRSYETAGQHVKINGLRQDDSYSVSAVIDNTPTYRRIRNGVTLTTFRLSDETGSVDAVFFNQPYMSKMYKKGDAVYVSGKIKQIGRRLQFTNPHIEKGSGQHQGINSVYPLTGGLTQKVMRIVVKNALEACFGSFHDIFPNSFRENYNLAEVNYCLKNIHQPEDEAALEKAKHRLIFEELLLFNIAISQREDTGSTSAVSLKSNADVKQEFLEMLPYSPTGAQQRVMTEIENDIETTKPMSRLLQGDVGSGKTTPAFYAMYLCAKNSMQSVMMAPTEVLAKQHYKNALSVYSGTALNIELVTGSTTAAERKRICENIAGGLCDIVIGTHAVLYDNVQFASLGLIITDEQHRFGVNQRAMLESKSIAPHTLIMSATPIPRTLALILYGKTDISILDEMPPGRQPVKTFIVGEHKRKDMYGFCDKEIAEWSQIFVVCPLIEQSESLEAKSSEEVFDELTQRFGKNRVALLHGKMKPQEKNEIMEHFKNGDFAILVSTTVIEVGVDVPNATTMIIENADRFGLAQLHQLRGRVGRGDKRSYCFLMCDKEGVERLNILTKTNDGFKIAEEDLRLRGPGQFLGSRQSGMSDLYMANLIGDMKLLHYTRKVAEQLRIKDASLYSILEKAADNRFNFDNITTN